jgi:magnesium-transporting ATPase (P-type)
LINITLYGLIAFLLEVILARTQVRAMSDRKMITKKKLLKELIKLIAPLILILGIYAVVVYLCIRYPPYSNNVFMKSLGFWLVALDSDLSALYVVYLEKDDLRSSITELRHKAIRYVKLVTIMAYIFTAIYIVGGGLVLVTYLIYLRAVASGLTKIPAFLTYQQAILILLLLVVLLPLTYVVRREARKAIRLGMENAMTA